MRGDTRRWIETELPEELRSVLKSAKEDEANAAQLARLRKAVEGAIGPGAFEASAPPANEPAATSGTPNATWANASQPLTNALPWALTAIAAIGLATLAARWTSTPAKPEAPQAPSAAAPAIASIAAVPSLPLPPIVESVEPPKPQPAPRAPASARPPALRPTLAEELASLDRIRSQMQTPVQAAVAVRRHAAVFRDGALIPERQLLELEIALRTDQTAKVKRLSKLMTRENSTFPYRARALKLLSDFGQ